MGVVEGSELSGAAIQVDETWAKSGQETKAVIDCNDTEPHLDFTRKKTFCGKSDMKTWCRNHWNNHIWNDAADSEYFIRIYCVIRELEEHSHIWIREVNQLISGKLDGLILGKCEGKGESERVVDVLPEWTVRGVKSSECVKRKDGSESQTRKGGAFLYNRTRPNTPWMHSTHTEPQAEHNTTPWKPMLLGVLLGCEQLAHDRLVAFSYYWEMEKHSCQFWQRSNNQKLSQGQCPPHWVSPHACQQNTANASFGPSTQWFETHHGVFSLFSPHSTRPAPFQEHPGRLQTNIDWILGRQGTATYSKCMGDTNS